MNDSFGKQHWDRTRYRGPEHPVVRAFAAAKFDVLARLARDAGGSPAALMGDRLARVLDLGAGPGVFTAPLTRHYERVVALDVHFDFLRRNPSPVRVRGDALRLPFPDGAFDLVFEANLLHHLDDPARCLGECRRVLSPGGAVLSVEPNAWHPLMYLFGVAVEEERRLLAYTGRHGARLAGEAGLRVAACAVSGQIFQNKTPVWMLPFLLPFERLAYPLGAYRLSVLVKA